MDLLSIMLIGFISVSAIATVLLHYKNEIKALVLRKPFEDENETIDYNTYAIKPLERVGYIIVSSIVLIAVGYVFYRSIAIALLLTPVSLYYPKLRRRQIIQRRKTELKQQFKDALQSISSSLFAGRSFESALKSAISDLLIQYEKDAYIVRELNVIERKLEANETVENAFAEFAQRSHLEEIESFSETLEICKRSGGNLITAIKSSSEIISDKIEVQNEIQSILSQKKLEQKILSVMPIAIILMLSMSAMDFMLPVFTQAAGRIVMTISMALFAASYFISEKITNIEV